MKYEKLFEKARIGNLELKNRIAMAPMGTSLESVWGEITDDSIAWYVARARGGAGLIFTGGIFAATTVDPLRNPLLCPRIDDDCFRTGLARLSEAVHEAGAKIAAQLVLGCGLQAAGGPWEVGRQAREEVVAVSSSPSISPTTKRMARELAVAEIRKMVELFAQGVVRARDTGYDLVEINSHGGHLIPQFMSPYYNKRTDEYGGSFERRLRFLIELVEAGRQAAGPLFPITVKYSIDEYVDGGLHVEDSKKIALMLEKAGVSGITVSAGTHGGKVPTVAPAYFPEGYMIPLGEALKSVARVPVLLPGRLGNPDLAEKVLQEGKADIISLGRPLIADPDWPNKVFQGRASEIRRCIACNECIKGVFSKSPLLRCTVNAVAGRERRFEALVAAPTARRVIVVGAGPAGMEAARVAALRGHDVTLRDGGGHLGGQIAMGSVPPHKEVLRWIVDRKSVV